MEAFTLKRGDTAPSISAVLRDGEGDSAPVADLTGKTVRFRIRKLIPAEHCGCRPTLGPVLSESAAVVVTAAAGAVRYDWAAPDTAEAGQYAAEFVVTSAGRDSSYPDRGHIPFIVLE